MLSNSLGMHGLAVQPRILGGALTDRPATPSAAATGADAIVIGVDTHKDVHVMTSMTMTGRRLSTTSFATTTDGIGEAMIWASTSGTVKARRMGFRVDLRNLCDALHTLCEGVNYRQEPVVGDARSRPLMSMLAAGRETFHICPSVDQRCPQNVEAAPKS